MATGLLICCVGRTATKRLGYFVDMEKTYVGTMRLGETTPSYDSETPVTECAPVAEVSLLEIHDLASSFTGELEQIPPMYSAIKVGGERLYRKARRGETAPLPPRQVSVNRFEIGDVSLPDVSFTVSCSKGTYVRSLVHDFGQALGCGAHLTRLRRTLIGGHSVDEAFSIDSLRQKFGAKTH
jgi:tRNA pseudouridine55 synthase